MFETLCLSIIPFFDINVTVPDEGEQLELKVYDFKGPGVALAMYNVDEVWQLRVNVLAFYFFTCTSINISVDCFSL